MRIHFFLKIASLVRVANEVLFYAFSRMLTLLTLGFDILVSRWVSSGLVAASTDCRTQHDLDT